MRKRWIAILLGVAMAVSVVACGAEKTNQLADEKQSVEENQLADEKQSVEENQLAEENRVQIATYNEKESIDQKIVGVWDSIETENNGDKKIEIGDLSILPNGIVWGSDFVKCTEYLDGTAEAKKIKTSNNEINIWDIYKQIKVAKGEVSEEEAARYTDMKITYEFKDIARATYMMEQEEYFYEKDANDQLILHITGSYKENPTSVVTIDTTEVYEKDYPLYGTDNNAHSEDYVSMALLGNWEDSMGNQWEFGYKKNDENHWERTVSMTDSDGKRYEQGHVYTVYVIGEDVPTETMRFYFKDFSTAAYTIVSYDGKTFNFDDNGSSFVLTRK